MPIVPGMSRCIEMLSAMVRSLLMWTSELWWICAGLDTSSMLFLFCLLIKGGGNGKVGKEERRKEKSGTVLTSLLYRN
jgi:hypothetical protein